MAKKTDTLYVNCSSHTATYVTQLFKSNYSCETRNFFVYFFNKKKTKIIKKTETRMPMINRHKPTFMVSAKKHNEGVKRLAPTYIHNWPLQPFSQDY